MHLWKQLFILSLLPLVVIGCNNATKILPEQNIEYEIISFQKSQGKAGAPCSDDADVICASVDLSFPNITNAPTLDSIKSLNDYIVQLILNSDFETPDTKPENIEQLAFVFFQQFMDSPENSDWELQQHIKVLDSTNTYLCLENSKNGYTGGAHGFQFTQLSCIDPQTSQKIDLENLFNPGFAAELNTLGEKRFRLLKQLEENSDLEEAGFSFEGNQFGLNDNYAITKEGIRFYFNSYEIAPYVMGPTDILIPYREIKNLINPTGPLKDLI
jgi:predicted transcriptional regulator